MMITKKRKPAKDHPWIKDARKKRQPNEGTLDEGRKQRDVVKRRVTNEYYES